MRRRIICIVSLNYQQARCQLPGEQLSEEIASGVGTANCMVVNLNVWGKRIFRLRLLCVEDLTSLSPSFHIRCWTTRKNSVGLWIMKRVVVVPELRTRNHAHEELDGGGDWIETH